ncbi:1-deoxy-D-xylulose-5-phosphate reductoisomerase [Desulfovibrio litoralis]|uniref:1-deoxy-D-xylulose 5-phosphate reductoisomerase n=1 Tax=Desulfovibrio litoralis DSM 11393 TaxID=1121455 RepID=A0A1M7SH79_9BACT|nr:1-deoxy-D-xylulose-5-phosphate reductoisomerase [Desulfovibrio litoralis]SHN57814.1 1-deoxy-D-xylulose 5-phosphate reductoisomerase [Desulfovibrio litoralis DSM 11393]
MPDYITKMPMPYSELSPLTPRKLIIFGSTGSIGRNTLNVLRQLTPEKRSCFEVVGLVGGKNIELLAEQAAEFRPKYLGIQDVSLIDRLKALLPSGYKPELVSGSQGFSELASLAEVDMLMLAQSGAAGINATIAGAKAGKVLALANKEALVLAGSLVKKLCAESGAIILPVDSEHNAIFQVSHSENSKALKKIWLTASGGPFRSFSYEQLKTVSLEQALKHPKWNMGAKITIDSATMMNKGLEIIEAIHLFGAKTDEIKVVIHPESIVHSLVEFVDGSVLAQLGCPDMQIPISYCLGFNERLNAQQPALNLIEQKSLTFEDPNNKLFPALDLALLAYNSGQWSPIVLNAANEVAVAAFLNKQISFLDICNLVERALNSNLAQAFNAQAFDFETILALDQETRNKVLSWV